jgi:uncharacterized protein YjiS (DUF1127 family)
MSELFQIINNWIKKEEKARRTRQELSQLSDRDLNDIGISRCDIYRVAKSGAI